MKHIVIVVQTFINNNNGDNQKSFDPLNKLLEQGWKVETVVTAAIDGYFQTVFVLTT